MCSAAAWPGLWEFLHKCREGVRVPVGANLAEPSLGCWEPSEAQSYYRITE